MLKSVAMARRRDRDEPPDVLSAEELKQLRHRIAHLSPDGVRQFYERAFEECRLIYTRVPSPRKMHTGAGLEAAVEVAKLESGARLRLHGAHEGAHDLAVDLGRDRVHVDVLAGEKFAGVFHAVDSGRLDLDVFESGLLKFVAVLGVFEGAGNAAYPEQDAAANLGGDLAARYHVGDGEPPAGLQDAERFAQNAVFVGRKIDYAIRDDHVDAVVGERDVLDFAFQKFDVFDSGFALVFVRERQHLVGHVEAVGLAGGADSLRGEQHVDASAGAEIENDFAGVQPG